MAGGIIQLPIKDAAGNPRLERFWSDDGTVDGNLSPLSVNNAPSGLVPLTGLFTTVRIDTGLFEPIAGRNFNVGVWGTFVGTVQLERSFDGATWFAAAAGRSSPEAFVCVEPEAGVQYRMHCTAISSGQINWRISQ